VCIIRTVLIIAKMAALAVLLTFAVAIGQIMVDRGPSVPGKWEIIMPLNVSCILSLAVGVLVIPINDKGAEE
jgi:hypothetical protein